MPSLDDSNASALVPLGEVYIPSPRSGELTACYTASHWANFAQPWEMMVYSTDPDSKKSVEMPGVTMRVNTEGFIQQRSIHEEDCSSAALEG